MTAVHAAGYDLLQDRASAIHRASGPRSFVASCAACEHGSERTNAEHVGHILAPTRPLKPRRRANKTQNVPDWAFLPGMRIGYSLLRRVFPTVQRFPGRRGDDLLTGLIPRETAPAPAACPTTRPAPKITIPHTNVRIQWDVFDAETAATFADSVASSTSLDKRNEGPTTTATPAMEMIRPTLRRTTPEVATTATTAANATHAAVDESGYRELPITEIDCSPKPASKLPETHV